MENLITIQYFTGQLALPYVNLLSSGNAASAGAINKEQAELERHIARYQKEYLLLMFGLEVVPDVEGVQEILADDHIYVSPIANYVFCRVIPMYASRSTMAGEKQKKGFESEHTNYHSKMTLVWNDMVRMNAAIRELIYKDGKDAEYPTDYNNYIYSIQSYV